MLIFIFHTCFRANFTQKNDLFLYFSVFLFSSGIIFYGKIDLGGVWRSGFRRIFRQLDASALGAGRGMFFSCLFLCKFAEKK
jgi:hypothetical protein